MKFALVGKGSESLARSLSFEYLEFICMFVQTLIACAMERIIRDTDGNVISERPIGEIEIIRPPFRCIIRRDGQESPEKGNGVSVRCIPSTIVEMEVYRFSIVLWGASMGVWIAGRRDYNGSCFIGNTWKEAFEKAEIYFNEGCDNYERLVFERKQALKNAE